jgi:hypothetical protein
MRIDKLSNSIFSRWRCIVFVLPPVGQVCCDMSLFKLDPQKRILPSPDLKCYYNRPVHFIKNVSEKETISADEGATKRTLRG